MRGRTAYEIPGRVVGGVDRGEIVVVVVLVVVLVLVGCVRPTPPPVHMYICTYVHIPKKFCFDPVKVGRIYSIIYNIINCIIYYMKYNRKRNRYSKIIYNHIGNMQTIPKQQKRRLRRRFGGAGASRLPPKFVVLVWFAYFLYGCI